jgi:hypothetical protein
MKGVGRKNQERTPKMNTFARSVAIIGLAGAAALAIPTVSTAQVPFDTWSHVVNPTPYGLCWIPNDKPYMEFGRGYWGACPGAAAAPSPAMRARAQAVGKTHKKKKSYR